VVLGGFFGGAGQGGGGGGWVEHRRQILVKFSVAFGGLISSVPSLPSSSLSTTTYFT
jgi:hypothetical protein